jgi:pilus assembly protein Flp/PilA
MKSPSQPLRRSRGQGMTEYIIIVALIAVAAIGVITLFGNNLRRLFGQSADALAGNANVTNDADARKRELEDKKLENFGENNAY